MPNQQITHSELKRLLSYDPETGVVAWRPGETLRTGKVGNAKPTGHIRVAINGVRYSLARLCWFYVHGRWPVNVIDHINGDPGDNRLANLRDVTLTVNNQNRRHASRRSKTRQLGVIPGHNGRFLVAMSFGGKPLTVSGFTSIAEARSFYLHLKQRLHEGATA